MKERSTVGTIIARTFDKKTDERAWRVGAGGEETVGGRLEKLAKHGWHVLHAVPVGDRGSDIDHVVIGPGRRVHPQHQDAPRRPRLGRAQRGPGQRARRAVPAELAVRCRPAGRAAADRRCRIPGPGPSRPWCS